MHFGEILLLIKYDRSHNNLSLNQVSSGKTISKIVIISSLSESTVKALASITEETIGIRFTIDSISTVVSFPYSFSFASFLNASFLLLALELYHCNPKRKNERKRINFKRSLFD